MLCSPHAPPRPRRHPRPLMAEFKPLGRVEIGAAAPDFALPSASGGSVRLSALRGRMVVLEWTSPVCPFTQKKYADGSAQRLQRDAVRAGVRWLLIDTAAKGRPGWLAPAAARARLAKLRSPASAWLRDESGDVGRLYGAKTTPSFYVIGADGRLRYQGAADEDAFATGPTSLSWVREAVEDVLSGRPVRRSETRPYGCAVEY